MNVSELLGVLVLFIGVPLNLYVVVVLKRLYRQQRNSVTSVLLVVFVLITLLAFVFGLIFINNDTIPPPLNLITTKLLTRATQFAVVTIPALTFLLLYRKS